MRRAALASVLLIVGRTRVSSDGETDVAQKGAHGYQRYAGAADGPAAQAGGIEATSCVRTFGSFSCVTRWGPAVDPNIRYAPPPRDEREAAEVAARVRQWEARCRPIIHPDQYGVGRYWYAAPGCEHGVVSD